MDILYLQCIGILLYIAQGSRPDITYAINYLAQFALGTTLAHWEALDHLIVYLRMTVTTGILIKDSGSNSAFECYVDANWVAKGIDPHMVFFWSTTATPSPGSQSGRQQLHLRHVKPNVWRCHLQCKNVYGCLTSFNQYLELPYPDSIPTIRPQSTLQ
ncbi:hypothetical protein O181_007049 [Austropuccinia psidii MF-1]|uniref:Reverse transcriptase Ty1/copia-type domain-containing protein n=1 Tax=Austropuccinia psidii MF-1 TaxID=1389203 RepID=A0A9Q3GHH2_9BASI|nr:hypothetical protein [Austropuccinia psidii MF-1]